MQSFYTLVQSIIQIIQQLVALDKQKELFLTTFDKNFHKTLSTIRSDKILRRKRYSPIELNQDSLYNFLKTSKQTIVQCQLQINKNIQCNINILLQNQQRIQGQLINILKQQPSLYNLFQQIDFFKQGYIDCNSLLEFIWYYNTKKIAISYTECEKLFLLLKNNFLNTSNQLSLKQIESFIKLEIQLNIENDDQAKIFDRYEENSVSLLISSSENTVYLNKFDVSMGEQSKQHIRYNLKNFEKMITQKHARNIYYLQKIKTFEKKVSISQNIKNNLLYSNKQKQKLLEQQFLITSIAEKFNNICNLIVSFIHKNDIFTFLNGFAVIDIKENNKVSLKQFQLFIADCNLCIPQIKVQRFFNRHSENEMNYNSYLQIFKRYTSISKQYNICMKRKPFLYDYWPVKMQQDYCLLVKQLINEQQSLQQTLIEIKQQKMTQFLQNQQHFLILLANNYRYFGKFINDEGNIDGKKIFLLKSNNK